MTNKTISALSSASTIVGTEVLPIVQSSATVKVSVANLTSGLGTIIATKGGTGQTLYAVGDLLYADTTTSLAKLADVATGNALISGGVSTAPSWGNIGLTTHVSGILPVANGGTNNTTGAATAVTSNATSGVMQITGPAAASTRIATVPDANWTAARTDAAQTFTGLQTSTNGARAGHVYKSSIASGVATTLFSAAVAGRYDIFATVIAADAANYGSFATVVIDVTGRIVANNAPLVVLTLSGTNVQVTQTLGTAVDLKASWTFTPNES